MAYWRGKTGGAGEEGGVHEADQTSVACRLLYSSRQECVSSMDQFDPNTRYSTLLLLLLTYWQPYTSLSAVTATATAGVMSCHVIPLACSTHSFVFYSVDTALCNSLITEEMDD